MHIGLNLNLNSCRHYCIFNCHFIPTFQVFISFSHVTVNFQFIHSADPYFQSVVIIIFSHVSVRPSVHHFSKHRKTKKSLLKIIIATGGTVGLAEGINDDTCLVLFRSSNEVILAAEQ